MLASGFVRAVDLRHDGRQLFPGPGRHTAAEPLRAARRIEVAQLDPVVRVGQVLLAVQQPPHVLVDVVGHQHRTLDLPELDACPVDLPALDRAGVAMKDGTLVTSGGRVFGVTALGVSVQQARERAYAAVDAIELAGKQARRDIGARVTK